MENNTSSIGGGLVKLGGNLENPRASKPSDYPAIGPMGPEGMAEGEGKLVKQSTNQTGPRNAQDSGDQTPSVWGKDGEFPVQKNKGEGAGQTNVKCDWSVDFETGDISPSIVNEKY
jgi:hypothetical protein